MSQNCPSCGHGVRATARYCPQCGTRLDARLSPGDVLNRGDYSIVRSLTKGGMGAVYLAKDQRAFDRACVVKQMLEYYDPADPQERVRAEARFQEEGRTLASMAHPGTPRIYAFFSENGRYYIVMEYIQGETLEAFVTHEDDEGQIVSRKRLPREEVVRYSIQTARILEYLHAQPKPVVHQDIKPANLILESQLGQVRLVDFGTARAEIPPGGEPGTGRKSSVYGTDGYAPPEQYRGKPVPRSDVFALAATVYHLLTDDDPREHPFKWPAMEQIPRELALALKRALRNSPDQRSSAKKFRDDLEALSTPHRTLEAFTFPGGTQIRSVGALPSLSDEHWGAARSFLYDGDFRRWLRDINRHDLVTAADAIARKQTNQDVGLEGFLRVVDPGLPEPKIVVDQSVVDLGAIARESALTREVTALNTTRGYALASVKSSQPWLEVFPETLHLWAGEPADIRVNVRAEDLPFRAQQRGVVSIAEDGRDPLEIIVTARVSLLREAWRIIWRALSAAVPESWRSLSTTWGAIVGAAAAVSHVLATRAWILALVWLAMGIGIGLGLYFLPSDLASLGSLAELLQRPVVWGDYVTPVILGPPLLLSALWLAFVVLASVGSAVFGATRGAWRSFFQ